MPVYVSDLVAKGVNDSLSVVAKSLVTKGAEFSDKDHDLVKKVMATAKLLNAGIALTVC